ncbi:helix-turn-helix domain-containing protein [Pectobacterium punjabense]|uniref:helix-turn-helix domain-containing protein n=1 Tax=Pectobacterium punjabense TaxID=2108399 RepID=UPI0019691405|nr:helix-turn-helix transcriptional regulator [Pectobacterium punjabense]MBN3134844.1 helix-turn-helix transcriptional regulator [Pectobacterium punjabense]MCE5382272.1 helix-turn-helix transcriptional regulator [Pectobacterium punjabense]
MLPTHLKAARLHAKITQKKLDVLSGIEETTARFRVYQYESGTHRPIFETMCAFARVLNVPESYFYTLDDKFAERILKLYEDGE